jgi:hypothetical protein
MFVPAQRHAFASMPVMAGQEDFLASRDSTNVAPSLHSWGRSRLQEENVMDLTRLLCKFFPGVVAERSQQFDGRGQQVSG